MEVPIRMESAKSLTGQGGARHIYSRWVLRGILLLDSGAYLGAAPSEEIPDMELIRDERSGKPLFPGTSLAGALRSYLTDIACGYRSEEIQYVKLVFGEAKESEESNSYGQSNISVFESIGELDENHPIELRSGIRLDPKTGTVAKHALFEMEVLPPRTKFPIRLDITIPDKDSEKDIMSGVLKICQGLENGEIRIGGRKTRGFGQCHVETWSADRYDLQTETGWKQWLASDYGNDLKFNGDRHISDAISEHIEVNSLTLSFDKRRHIVVKLHLDLRGGLLIGGSGTDPDGPDIIHLTSARDSVIPGTSIAGALRARARRILNVFTDNKERVQNFMNSMFGTSATEEADSLKKSKLIVHESTLTGGQRLRPNRIKIDRFTGGVIDGALFEEEVYYGGSFDMIMELRNPKIAQVGLLLLLVKDLVDGDLPLGAASSVGRGYAEGTAEVTVFGKDLPSVDGTIRSEKSTIDTIEANRVVHMMIDELGVRD